MFDAWCGTVRVHFKPEPVVAAIVKIMADLASVEQVFLEGHFSGIGGVKGGGVHADACRNIRFCGGARRKAQHD